MDISSLFSQMLVLLILLLVGVVCAKTGVIDPDGNKKITAFTLAVPQSCMILASAINVDFEIAAAKLVAVFFSGFAFYAVLAALGALAYVLLGKRSAQRELFAFMTVFGNVGFMGLPVVQTLFGSQAVLYASLFNVPFNLLAYSVGAALLRGDMRGGWNWEVLLSPPMVSTCVAIVLLFAHIHIPTPVESAVDYMGDMIVPLSMIIIGASLGKMPLKTALGDWRCYAFSAFRLLAVPAAVFFVMGRFTSDMLVLGTMTVQAAMPVAAISAMLALQYGRNEALASKTVFISTLLSTLTIPLICWGLL